MKKTLKCLSVIIVMLIILFSFSITALAQTTTQDGLQVNLTTDKQSYSLNEDIKITISVTNTNDFTVKDVSIEALLPDNFELKDSNDETSTKAIDLKSGEQANLTVVAVVKGEEQNATKPTENTVEPSTVSDDTTEPTTKSTENNADNTQNTKPNTQTTTSIISNNDNNKSDKSDDNTKNNNNQDNTSIKTGADYTYMGIFIVLLLASISTLLYCLIKHFDKTTKIISSILCVVIAVTSVLGISKFNAFAQENKATAQESNSTITVSEQIKVDNNNYTINANIKYKVNDNIKIKLISDETEFSAEIKNKKIVFYAETDKKLDYIDLVCKENTSLSIKLFDNGLDNDNAKCDNIYSGAVVIDCNKENQYNFYAVYKQSLSNTVVIDIIEPFTDKELNDMESVDKMLSNLMKSEHYQSLDINSKKEEIEKVLYHCEDNGLIQENSIFYHDFPKSFEFKYDSGISGGVTFEKISPDVSTVKISNKDMISLAENNSGLLLSSKISKRTKDLEEAMLIYDLYSREEKQEEYDINQDIAKQWSENGLKTDFYTNPTVEDYKTILMNKKVIFIQEHGIELAKGVFSTNKVYCFTIREQITKENKQKYHTDLKKKRVYSEILSNGTIQYCISPDFFTYYYDDNKLNSSIVILGNCMGFGNEQVVDYNFSFDLCEKCGANTVIGFHNSVNTSYSDYFNCNFVLQLLKNKSVKEAFNYVQSEFGYNDNEFLYKFTDLDQYCDKENKITWRELISNRTAATPILSGETTNKLNHRYIVSSIVKDSKTNNPIKDVRVEVIDNSGDSLDPVVTTTTDENGNFSLNLPYGSYSLSFHHDNYNYYGTSLEVDSEYVILQNPVLLNPTTSENLIQNNDIVTLTGILKTEDYEINSNNKGTVTILDLDNPIKCYLKDGNNYDGKTEYNIKSVQISSPDLKEYIGQNVTVKGKVMLAHTAHHRRDVVLLESEVIKSGDDNVKFAGGDGTETNPYQVSTPEQLNAVRNDLSAHYVQINDIDMSSWGNWEPIGNVISCWGGAIGGSNYHEPVYIDNYFTGVYDGNNYKISNLTLVNNDISVTEDCFGLFAGLKNSIVKNVILNNIIYNIDKETTDYSSYWTNQECTFSLSVGGIAGICDTSTISNCSVDGKIDVVNCSDVYVGGIAGTGDTIINCNNNSEIYVYANKDSRFEKDSNVYCGGIVGNTIAVNSEISCCKNNGNINVAAGYFAYCGGISGEYGYIEKCINYGNITGNVFNSSAYSGFAGISNVGGIVGATSSDNVSFCINYGNISSCAKTNGNTTYLTSYAGGIAGFCGYSRSGNINNCYNYNKTIISQTKDKDGNLLIGNAGRVAGYSIKISSCYSINSTTINGNIPTENIAPNAINGGSLTKKEMDEKVKDLV